MKNSPIIFQHDFNIVEHELGKLDIKYEVRGNKIKLGYGKEVCEILAALCNKGLKHQKIKLGQPSFPKG